MNCISLCCPACFSGFVTITKKTGFLNKATVTAVYDHYSDDGRVYIHGTETSSGSVTSKTTYRSRLELTDPEGNSLGRMDVDLAMSAAYSAAIPVPRLTNTSQAARLCGAKPKPTRLLLYHKHIIPHASNSSETIGSEEFFFLLFQHTALRDGCTVQLLL